MMAENALNTADLLERCREWVRRYVVLTEHQAIVLAAWVLHTWAIDAADYTPYIHITAPEKQCGKSILLRVLQAIVCRPCKSGGMSAAALVRTSTLTAPLC
jgi:putative DNA primase/helicase